MVFGRGNRPLPPGEGDPQQSLASLGELNGLLELALRMSGDDTASMLSNHIPSSSANATETETATYPPPATLAAVDDAESTSSSWRLDTTRKLTSVSKHTAN